MGLWALTWLLYCLAALFAETAAEPKSFMFQCVRGSRARVRRACNGQIGAGSWGLGEEHLQPRGARRGLCKCSVVACSLGASMVLRQAAGAAWVGRPAAPRRALPRWPLSSLSSPFYAWCLGRQPAEAGGEEEAEEEAPPAKGKGRKGKAARAGSKRKAPAGGKAAAPEAKRPVKEDIASEIQGLFTASFA